MNKKLRKLLPTHFLIFAVISVLELFFFRNVLGNGKLFGDSGDGRLTMLITEHWWRFFTGKENFADLLMFFPTKGTLGYSDMLLGFGIVHSFFRLLGIDMYLSYKFTLMVLHVVGSFSFFYLLQKKLHLSNFWSFVSLISFSYSTTFANLAFGHSQISAINFLPLFSIFLVSIAENWNNRYLRNINVALLIASYALICYTAWYIAFFTALFCIILLLVYGIKLSKEGISIKSTVSAFFFTFGIDLFFLLVFAAIIMIPFAITYLPAFRHSGGYAYAPEYIPELIDIVNVSPQNLVLGKFVKKMNLKGGEVQTGFSIVVLLLFIITYKIRNTSSDKHIQALKDALFYTVLISFLFCIKLGSPSISLWYLIYKFVPGGSAIRAVGRFLFFLSYPLSLCLALHGNGIMQKPEKVSLYSKKPVVFEVVFLFILFISQVRVEGVSSHWRRGVQKNILSEIHTPPKEATCFYLIAKDDEKRTPPYLQLDAYEIATTFNIPTLNGYSGQQPIGWSGIWEIRNDQYLSAITSWITQNNLTDVYAYNSKTKSWEKHSNFIKKIALSSPLSFFGAQNNSRAYITTGLSGAEEHFTWTEGHHLDFFATFEAYDPKKSIHAFIDCGVFNGTQRVNVIVNESQRIELLARDGIPLEFDFELSDNGKVHIEMEFPDAVSPKSLGMSGDPRVLALALKTITFSQPEQN